MAALFKKKNEERSQGREGGERKMFIHCVRPTEKLDSEEGKEKKTNRYKETVKR